MTTFDPHQRQLHEQAESARRIATSSRMGVVKEVQQEGGERKVRVIIGVDPDGKELLGPWMNTTEQRGATRSQTQYKPGQNVRVSAVDGDFRQATVTPYAEGTSFPQPDNAKDHGYGDSYQAGKIHQGVWMPEEKNDQQGGQQGGSQQQQGGKQGEQNHRHETWIAVDENKPPQHSGRSREEQVSASGGEQDQQQPEQKKPQAASMISLDEKNGYTARVGSDVRVAAHGDGAKIRAGETYFVAQKDKDALIVSKENIYVRGEKSNTVNEPWVIGKGPDDPIPNDNKLGNK